MKQKYTESWGGCRECLCRTCLLWWSGRCPYGGCYDDYRAAFEPYNMWNTGVRTGWSNWNRPGEQQYWCRGSVFYNQQCCTEYIKYSGKAEVRHCLEENVQIFQDGYIQCGIANDPERGCAWCYKRLEEKQEQEESPNS